MATSGSSTGERLTLLINDIELISKELIENYIAQKHQKLTTADHVQITELLVMKDNELRETLKLAEEQAQINQKMEVLKSEVDRQDNDIRQLQRQLKEAEQILSTAIYQAKQKLASIARASRCPVPSEDLIKFAHRISASNAVCAPLSWQPGDPRRPYPTDIEMRLGFLGRLSDLPINGHLLQPPSSLADIHRPTGHPAEVPAAASANQFAWHPSGEMHVGVGGGGSVVMDTRAKDTEDVEVMSTDSSSSSSSDSQ